MRGENETNVKVSASFPLKREFQHFITFPIKSKPHDRIKLLTINPEYVSVNYPKALTLQIIDMRGPSLGEGIWLSFHIDVLV